MLVCLVAAPALADLPRVRVLSSAGVVEQLPLEDYVAGTVAGEVPLSWAAEVLRAQAVVARSYALHERERNRAERFDVHNGTRSQVYRRTSAGSPAQAAALHTQGEYLAYAGRPILAVYHSASGGRTASAEEVWGRPLPYLVSLDVEDEQDSPDTYWRVTFPSANLRRSLKPWLGGLGGLRGLEVAERTPSGRARSVRLLGTQGSGQIEARALRQALGERRIRSTAFEIRSTPDGFVFVGSGHGHGVGMSQWGARAMAERGASYQEIVAHFYPGATLTQLGGAKPEARP